MITTIQFYLTIIGLVFTIFVTVGFIIHSVITDRIIKNQEKEIARLTTQLKRERQKEPLCIIQDGRNPKFGDF